MKEKAYSYKKKLEHEIEEYMELPISERRYSAIKGMIECWQEVDKLEKKCGATGEFNEQIAEMWVNGMINEDGTVGAHWKKEETTAEAKTANVKFEHITDYCWWVTMNMMYSDYHAVAKKYGCDNTMFYADMAKAFLFDKDAGTPREKLSAYYHGIAKKE